VSPYTEPQPVSGNFTLHTVVRVACGACKEPYEDDDLGRLDFDSLQDATRCVTAAGWSVVGDQARCASCALVEECGQKGHLWDDWWACRCGCAEAEPTIPVHQQPMQCRACARCVEGEERTAEVSG
jgi:hypothetical protein